MNWSFGDQAGWMIGAGVFGVLSLALGWAVYGVSYRLLAMGSLGQPVSASRRGSVALGLIAGAGIFAMLAMTSLNGFAQLMLQNDTLTIQYRWIGQTVVLPFIEVMNVQEEPALKGQWRLVVVTDTNGIYESALASRTDVQQAAEWLRQQIQHPISSLE